MRTKILYEDRHIIVVHKPAGIAVQSGRIGQADVESELKNHLAGEGVTKTAKGGAAKGCTAGPKGKQPYLGVIHRLDQPVEGVLVFAKTPHAAAALNRQLAGENFCKDYLAAVCGKPEPDKQELVDYIKKEGGLAKICPPADMEAKKAVLSFETQAAKAVGQEVVSLLSVHLKTGRFHQIRAQLSHAGYPLLGDAKYGSERSRALSQSLQVPNVALCAVHLSFQHPVSGEKMEYNVSSVQSVFALFHE